MNGRPPRIIIAIAFMNLALAASSACVRSLREPPPLASLGGAPAPAGAAAPAGPGVLARQDEVEALLARAEGSYAARTLEDVRRAASIWLEAARADDRRVEGLVGAVRAQVWIADHEAAAKARDEAATLAVQSAQWCGRISADNPACSFWLGAALGVQARERRATALDALPKIVEAFQRAADADPALEEAGPDRALAILYARAPGWPTGPGDPDLSLAHAKKAVELRPDFPPNQLALAEALRANGDREGSLKVYERSLELARDFAAKGDRDAQEWVQEAEEALRVRRDHQEGSSPPSRSRPPPERGGAPSRRAPSPHATPARGAAPTPARRSPSRARVSPA